MTTTIDDPLRSAFPRASYETWRAEVERGLKGADFAQRLITRTLEGIEVQPLYTERDFRIDGDPAGFPGAPPYRRGATAIGRYGQAWDMRPRYDNPDASQVGREIGADLQRGARSLWLCFDRQVRAGQASPEPVRELGLPLLGARQLGQLLDAVPLPQVALSLDAGANALAMAACFFAGARARRIELAQLEGWLNADPLGALARDGSLPCSLDAARAQLVALAAFCAEHAPRMRSAIVSVVPYHDAGAHAAQELAYALASAVTYLRWLTEAGLSLAQACDQLAFSVAVGSDFFMEIAKLRALRQCWAAVVNASGGGAAEQRCVIHAATSARTKSKRDPWVNLLRETSEAFAAAAGGADAITTSGFDRLHGVSDAFGRRIAANAQAILNEEAHVTRVADPAGGAFYVEALTDQLAEQAWALFQALEASGGMAAALTSGRLAQQLADTAGARGGRIERRKQVITGVSDFAQVDEPRVERAEPDWPAIERARRAELAAGEDDASVARELVQGHARGAGLAELAIELAGKGANLGQLSRALAAATGGAEPARIEPLPLRRDAAVFERLRDACDARERATGKRPSVFLCNLGTVAEHTARAQFASGFFAAGGLRVIGNDGFAEPEQAADAYARSGAELCAICGSDAAYPSWVERVAPLLLARGAVRVIVAGRPGQAEARYRAAGVSDFIHVGSNVVELLEASLAASGVASGEAEGT